MATVVLLTIRYHIPVVENTPMMIDAADLALTTY